MAFRFGASPLALLAAGAALVLGSFVMLGLEPRVASLALFGGGGALMAGVVLGYRVPPAEDAQ